MSDVLECNFDASSFMKFERGSQKPETPGSHH